MRTVPILIATLASALASALATSSVDATGARAAIGGAFGQRVDLDVQDPGFGKVSRQFQVFAPPPPKDGGAKQALVLDFHGFYDNAWDEACACWVAIAMRARPRGKRAAVATKE